MSEPTNNIVDTMTFYGTPDDPLMDFPFNVNFVFDINNQTNASTLMLAIDKWIENMPAHATANWVVSHFSANCMQHALTIINFSRWEITINRETGHAREKSLPCHWAWWIFCYPAFPSPTTAKKSTWTTLSSPGNKPKTRKAAMLALITIKGSPEIRKERLSNGTVNHSPVEQMFLGGLIFL